MMYLVPVLFVALNVAMTVMLGGTSFYLYESNPLYFVFSLVCFLLCWSTLYITNCMTKNVYIKLLYWLVRSRVANLVNVIKLDVVKLHINTTHKKRGK